jgi:hypothetical protein
MIIKSNNIEIARADPNGYLYVGVGNADPQNTSSLVVNAGVAINEGKFTITKEIDDNSVFDQLTLTKNSLQTTVFDQDGTTISNLLINPLGGNVGIGNTGTLQNKLQIGNPPGFSGNDIAIGNGVQAMSLFQSPTASTFYTNTNFAFMPASGTGNVGIGTTNPTNKLSVNGSIRSHEVIVELANWPDYVFSPSYKLPSLASVEQHIKEHSHLPNIPSAKTMEANGQSIGETQRLMMEKIEELTLYIIEQNKRIEKLEADKLFNSKSKK